MNVIDNDVSLTVLRKYDPQCLNIIDCCNKVKVYNFDKMKNSWVTKDQSEGVFYLIKRVLSPLYKFVILDKSNKPGSVPSTIDIPISQFMRGDRRSHFYMFKNEFGVIQAIMFSNENDCDRIFQKVNKLINELEVSSEKASTKDTRYVRPNFLDTMNGVNELLSDSIYTDDKIFSLLESARQRYNEGHGDQANMSTSTPSRQSRQIDINELFMTKNGPTIPNSTTKSNMFHSYPQRGSVNRTMSFDSKENGPATLTVTQLEEYFVQGASASDTHDALFNDDSDDDGELLNPQMLATASTSRSNKCSDPILSKEQLRDALIHMLQIDNDSEEDGGTGGRFLSQLHEAYSDLCVRRSSMARK